MQMLKEQPLKDKIMASWKYVHKIFGGEDVEKPPVIFEMDKTIHDT